MMWMTNLFSVLVVISFAQTAELHKFQSWATQGGSSGAAWGETLLEVEEAPGGAVVRWVYVGLRDVACGGVTAMAWEKHVSQSPASLAEPLKLCQVSRDLERLVERHHFDFQGIEGDGEALVTQCEGRKSVAGIPIQFADLRKGPDLRYMNLVYGLDSKIMKAAWGKNAPDIDVIDPNAERDGENFVARARKSDYGNDDPFHLRNSLLRSYKGPLGKPAHEWRIDTPPGVKILSRNEPRLFRSAHHPGVKPYTMILGLTVDPHSGKVRSLKMPPVDDSSWIFTGIMWSDAMTWVFDPATIPTDGLIQLKVHFKAECGQER
jgi:hypothetical protein